MIGAANHIEQQEVVEELRKATVLLECDEVFVDPVLEVVEDVDKEGLPDILELLRRSEHHHAKHHEAGQHNQHVQEQDCLNHYNLAHQERYQVGVARIFQVASDLKPAEEGTYTSAEEAAQAQSHHQKVPYAQQRDLLSKVHARKFLAVGDALYRNGMLLVARIPA